MTDLLAYLLLGVGAGAAIALLAIGVVLTNRASSVVNFGHAAMGMWSAYVFYNFRETGDIALPMPFDELPFGIKTPSWLQAIHVLDRPTVVAALIITLIYAALFGLAVYLLIFRWLRNSPPLGRIVASVGLFLFLYATAALRFPVVPTTRPILPGGSISLFDKLIFVDRLVVAAIAVVLTAVLWLVYRFTRFGLSTIAASESAKGAALTGINPDRLAAINWSIASVLSATAIILIARVNSLDPLNLSLLIVPALAAALLGGFRSFVWVAVAAFGIGMLQSELVNLRSDIPALRGLGLPEGLPFLLILGALFLRSRAAPARGGEATQRLPTSPTPRFVIPVAVVALASGIVVMLQGSSDWRLAVITSSITAILSLSIVVLTGFIGQISLAPYAFAGFSAFTIVRLDASGIAFPWAPIIAVALTTALGVLVGIPGTRVRGYHLAIATLGAAVAIEQLVFKWSWFVGDRTVGPARFLGINFSITAKGSDYPRVAFGIMVVVIAVGSCVAAANIRRGPTGQSWLAVRTNEKAAAAAGIDVARAKLSAFAVSACFAGMAGALIAYARQTVSEQSFLVFFSLAALAITYLMGIGSVSGAVGAGVLAPLGILVMLRNGSLPTDVSKYEFALNGLMLIVVTIVLPNGLLPSIGAGLKRLAARRSAAPAVIAPVN